MQLGVFGTAMVATILTAIPTHDAIAGRHDASILQPILVALQNAKSPGGSLEFSGTCDLENFPYLPGVGTSKAVNASSALEGLRDIFAANPAIQVNQDSDGMIRMTETGIPTDILNVEISRISFQDYKGNGIFNPNDALRVVLRAPEVGSFMEERDIEIPSGTEAVPGNAGSWPPELPHLSGSLDNVSLRQALDHILKSFPGIWVYESCPKTETRGRLAYFRFFFLRKVAGRIFVEE